MTGRVGVHATHEVMSSKREYLASGLIDVLHRDVDVGLLRHCGIRRRLLVHRDHGEVTVVERDRLTQQGGPELR